MKSCSLLCLGLLAAALVCAQATTTEQLLRDLSSPDKQVRINALRDLSRATPVDRIVFAITAALRDNDESVRMEAAGSLARIGADAISAAPELLRALDDASVNVQSAAAFALGQMRAGGDAALPRVRLLATERSFVVRRMAAETLALIGAERSEVIRLLEILLNDSEVDVRNNALDGLLSLQSPVETVALAAKLLQGEDAKLRLRAFVKLRDITHLTPTATPLIVQGLDDADPQVQFAAISALEGRHPALPGTAEGLARIVSDDGAWIRNRIRAAHAVGTFGDQALVAETALRAALGINHSTFQGTALQALVRLGVEPEPQGVVWPNHSDVSGIPYMSSAPLPSPQELDQWIADLTGPDVQRRYIALGDLVAIGPAAAKAAPALANTLRDGSMRNQALEALQQIGEPAIPVLMPLFNDPDPIVRQDAVNALSRPGREGSPAAAAALVQAAQSEFEEVRRSAIEGLGNMNSSPQIAVPALLSILETPDARASAILALMYFSNSADVIVPALIPYLKDPDPLVVTAATRVLNEMGPSAAAAFPHFVTALGAATGESRESLIEAVSAWADGTPASLEVLFAALQESSPRSRAHITRGLARIGSEEPRPETIPVVVAKLTELLSDSDWDIRNEALWAVERIGVDAASAWPQVEALIGDPSYQVRARAARTLTILATQINQPERPVALLMALLSDPHDEVRASAANSLGMLGMAGRAALPALRDLLDDPSQTVRDTAGFVVGAMTGNLPTQL